MTEEIAASEIPADDALEAMNHAELGELLTAHGVELTNDDHGSKERRRAVLRAMRSGSAAAKCDETETPISADILPPNCTTAHIINAAAKSAHRTGDHAAHAAFHHLELAIGELKQAILSAEPFVKEGTAERTFIESCKAIF